MTTAHCYTLPTFTHFITRSPYEILCDSVQKLVRAWMCVCFLSRLLPVGSLHAAVVCHAAAAALFKPKQACGVSRLRSEVKEDAQIGTLALVQLGDPARLRIWKCVCMHMLMLMSRC